MKNVRLDITLLLAVLFLCAGFTTVTLADSSSAETPKVEPEKKAAAEKEPVKVTIAHIVLSGSLGESPSAASLLGQPSTNLTEAIRRLDAAAADEKIKAVWLSIRGIALGRGRTAELRAAIARVRTAGKRVIAELESCEATQYLVATACNEIVLPESGVLLIPGLRAEITFYKKLLDRFDIKADMLQVGDFKGAAEPMTRTGMSPAFRKQYENLIDDMYEQMIETIAEDRNLDKGTVKKQVDIGLISARAAKKAGLINRVMYTDQLAEALKKEYKADELIIKKGYAKKKAKQTLTGLAGMIKLIDLAMNGDKAEEKTGKKIAIVNAIGSITSGKSASSIFGGQSMGSDTIIKALDTADKDKDVCAIILRINSPGGSALASDLIWHKIRTIKKPVIASMSDTAASGGYYIAMGCDKIYATPGTLTGSIGVVGGKVAIGGLYDKFGLTTDVISRGKNSGLFSQSTPFTESEKAAFLANMKVTYEQFLSKTAKGRHMDRAKLDTLAGGRVWTGRQARVNGLIDKLGTLEDAIADARRMAKIDPDEKLQRMRLPQAPSFLEQMLGVDTGATTTMKSIKAAVPGIGDHLGEIETLHRLFKEPSVLMMPYRVNIK